MIVKYQGLFPTGPYLNEDIGFDISIPDESTEEEMIEAVLRLKRIATKAHEKANPLSDSSGEASVTLGSNKTINLAHERLKEKIDDCTSQKELMEFISLNDIPEEVKPYIEQKKNKLQ